MHRRFLAWPDLVGERVGTGNVRPVPRDPMGAISSHARAATLVAHEHRIVVERLYPTGADQDRVAVAYFNTLLLCNILQEVTLYFLVGSHTLDSQITRYVQQYPPPDHWWYLINPAFRKPELAMLDSEHVRSAVQFAVFGYVTHRVHVGADVAAHDDQIVGRGAIAVLVVAVHRPLGEYKRWVRGCMGNEVSQRHTQIVDGALSD